MLKHPVFLIFTSAILLVIAFPGYQFSFCAWLALVPFFFAMTRCKNSIQAVNYGFLQGVVFFAISTHWFTFVHPWAWLLMIVLEGLFFGLWGFCVYQSLCVDNRWIRLWMLAAGWTVMEFVRGEFPIFGFPWNLLAYSQADNLVVLQSANTIGAYGLGFVIALVNAFLFEIVKPIFINKGTSKKNRTRVFGLCWVLVLIVGLLLAHGKYHLQKDNSAEQSLRISLAQGNIPQKIKWEETARPKILEIYSKLSELASYDQADLIIWPEASFPGYFNHHPDRQQIIDKIKLLELPVVLGAPYWVSWQEAYNSAYFVDGHGETIARYDKQYLVPFGEYVPLKWLLGWLEPLAYSLGVSDFNSGSGTVIFKTPHENIMFSVLICFEDVFSHLARDAVKQGAQFLAVITNDAWFGPTAATYQHTQASVFRAVEMGVPVVRAANVGVSSFISAKGEVLDRVLGAKGDDIFVMGQKTFNLPLERIETGYRYGGWLFPYGNLALFATMLLILRRRRGDGNES